MVQRQHGVGLAAAEVGLQFDDGVTAAPCQPLGCADQEGAEAVRQVGAAEELLRIAVVGGGAAGMHLGAIGSELSLLEVALRQDVGWTSELAPRPKDGSRADGEF